VQVAIRKMRQEGKKVGLVRMRWFRPFAAEELAKTLSRFKAVGVIDRDFSSVPLSQRRAGHGGSRGLVCECQTTRLWWALFAAGRARSFGCRT